MRIISGRFKGKKLLLPKDKNTRPLKDLVKEFLGIEISKQQQSSDFGGKLSEKQLRYCANDVIYLHKIFSNLKEILIRENRYELYTKAIGCIQTRVDLDLALFTEDIWSH